MNDFQPAPMIENPNVEKINGIYTDMLIEQLISYVWNNEYDDPSFDEAFNVILKRYISEDAPYLCAAYAGKRREQAGSVHFLMVFGMDFDVINATGARWPKNGFENMPDATCAVCIAYANGEEQTDFFPGVSINQAALGALLQYTREIALGFYNQPDLDFEGKDDHGPVSIN
jgi:hypothetical protein